MPIRGDAPPLPAPKVPQLQFEVPHLNRSLSVLLPVHNSQATLESDVARIGRSSRIVARFRRRDHRRRVDRRHLGIAEDLACRYRKSRSRASRSVKVPPPPFAPAPAARGNTVIAHDGHRGVDPQQVVRIWREAEARGICANAMAQRAVPRPLASAMLDARLNGHRLGRLHARSAAHG